MVDMENTLTITNVGQLQFRDITAADFADITRYMNLTDSRTCDYTLGGIVLWSDHFNYKMAMADDTLFISGGREDNLSVTAYALPLGSSDFHASVARLRSAADRPVWFSAIPEDRLHLFASEPSVSVAELGREWSDYLYDIHALAGLSGGAMKKKRNHVNRFLADHPDAELRGLDAASLERCRALVEACGHDGTPTGRSEFDAVMTMLDRWADYAPFFRAAVLTAGNELMGFTVGEIKGDTLHVHVERANHLVAGANEALTSMFAAEMCRLQPRLLYVNRQDDAGDAGMRASKESWRPLRLLPKFNVRVG